MKTTKTVTETHPVIDYFSDKAIPNRARLFVRRQNDYVATPVTGFTINPVTRRIFAQGYNMARFMVDPQDYMYAEYEVEVRSA